jgi:hypothetical protein
MSCTKNNEEWDQIASFCNKGVRFWFQLHHGIILTVSISLLTADGAKYAFAEFLFNGMRRQFECLQWQ